DEEDVALSAFHTFCQAVSGKRVPQVKDRDDLWRILVRITVSKAIDQRRRHFSQKRGGGRGASGGAPEGLDAGLGRPGPEVGQGTRAARGAQEDRRGAITVGAPAGGGAAQDSLLEVGRHPQRGVVSQDEHQPPPGGRRPGRGPRQGGGGGRGPPAVATSGLAW